MEWRPLKALRGSVMARRVGLGVIGLAAGLGLSILVDCLFWDWLPTDTDGFVTSKDRWDLRMKALGGLLVAAGFVLTAWRIKVSNKQAEAALRQAENAAEQATILAKQAETAARQVAAVEDGQVTERFTKAIEQLGSEKEEIRLGAIYALERIARDSEKDHWTVMEILAAYVRKHARRSDSHAERSRNAHCPPEGDDTVKVVRIPPREDIQAAVKAIGRRKARREPGRIDLSATDLALIDLRSSNLKYSDLTDAILWGAKLERTHLERASLRMADLRKADLTRAHLDEADLMEANLRWACFGCASLSGVHLEGSDLRHARNLLPEDLKNKGITVDEKTQMPSGLEYVVGDIMREMKERQQREIDSMNKDLLG